MKLRNKKTGEIVEPRKIGFEIYSFNERNYNSLAELNEEWEDYEEPKDFYFIQADGDTHLVQCKTPEYQMKKFKSMGNYFETREEAEKAVEKLKAWKRLRDKGFRFDGWTIDDGLRISICSNTDSDDIYEEDKRELKKELDLLFGDEE